MPRTSGSTLSGQPCPAMHVRPNFKTRQTRCQAQQQAGTSSLESLLKSLSPSVLSSAVKDSRRLNISAAAVAEPRVNVLPFRVPTTTSSSSTLGQLLLDRMPQLQPTRPSSHPVVQLIHQRLQDGSDSRPGQRKDNFKLGLVVEGGGMRGIVTGAMLMGIQDMGLTNVFDAVYGASAGAINATYFLSGQPEGLDIYTDHLAAGSRFLSLKRYWGKTPVMDLGYLLEEVMADIIPLDWQAVIDSQLPLKVVASSLTTLRTEILDNFTDRHDLAECLKASANVPEIVGPPRRHRGHDLVDAAVFEPIPVKAALRDGCTHVLALCSRPHKVQPAWSKYISNALANAVKYWLLNPPYMREAWRVEPLHQSHQGQPLDDLLLQVLMHGQALELDAALDHCSSSPSSSGSSSPSLSPTSTTDGSDLLLPQPSREGVLAAEGLLRAGHVFPVYPGDDALFAPICTNVETLQLGRQEGYRSVHKLMSAVAELQQQPVLL